MSGYGNLADTSVTCFVSLPGFLLLADWTVATHTRAEKLDNPFFHAFVGSLVPCQADIQEKTIGCGLPFNTG